MSEAMLRSPHGSRARWPGARQGTEALRAGHRQPAGGMAQPACEEERRVPTEAAEAEAEAAAETAATGRAGGAKADGGSGQEPTTLVGKVHSFWAKTKAVCSLLQAGPELSFQAGPYEVDGVLTEAGVRLAVFLASERGHELRYAVDGTTDIQFTMNTFNHIRRRTIHKTGGGGEERVTNTRFVHVVDFHRELQREADAATSGMAAAALLLIAAYPLAQQPSLLRSWSSWHIGLTKARKGNET